jgi:hypothetical protein
LSDELLIHFNQFPWPLASGVEWAARLASEGRTAQFIFAGHAVPERGLFLPFPRALSRSLGIALPEIQRMTVGSLTLSSLPTYDRAKSRSMSIEGWREFAHESSWRALEQISVDGLPGGRAVANYLVRRAGTRHIGLPSKRSRIKFLLSAYGETCRLATRLIEVHGPGRVHAYQGNWLNDRAVLDVSKAIGIPYSVYGEVAPGEYWHWDRDPYQMRSWRDLDVWSAWIERTRGVSVEQKQALIEEAIYGAAAPDRNPFSTLGQQDKRVGIPATEYVAFFTANSSDERFGLDADWDPFWPNQVNCVIELASALASIGRSLVVRIHPNTASKPACEQQPWRDLATKSEQGLVPGLVVIPATSPADSYELARRASASVTWGSNISVELVARGLRTVNVAPAAFDPLEAVPLAASLNSLLREINGPPVGDAQKERAAAWLWYMRSSWSHDFEFVRIVHEENGRAVPTFEGHQLSGPNRIARLSRPWSRIRASDPASPIMCRRYHVPA